MKKGLKIVTIGGGSSYTPELMEGFIKRYQELPIEEIHLVDIYEGKEKLEIDAKMAQRMWDAAGYPVKVFATLNRKEALKDADFVTTQFRVGLLDARIKDERIPSSYGMLGQETNGAGGIFKAFRTIPVILGIVEDMKQMCPKAWLINFTNPSGMVTEAVIKYGKWKKCIGLCNIPVLSMIKEPEALNQKLVHQFAGLNHFHWHRVFDEKGEDVSQKVLDAFYEGKDIGLPKNIANVLFDRDQLETSQLIPCAYHRYYFCQEEMLEHSLKEYESIGTRGQQVRETEEKLFKLYQDPNLNYKPKELSMRGGAHYSDAACECINAIYNDKKIHMVVSTQNHGAICDLPEDCVVEVSSYLTSKGAMPVAWGKFPSAQRGWLQCMKAMEECTIEAAVTGNYGMALEAFYLNPLIQSGASAKRILDEMLIEHQAYLPQFKQAIENLGDIEIKDEVVRQMMERENKR